MQSLCMLIRTYDTQIDSNSHKRKREERALVGPPRQVGKSTLMMGLVPDLLINLNDDKTYLVFNGQS